MCIRDRLGGEPREGGLADAGIAREDDTASPGPSRERRGDREELDLPLNQRPRRTHALILSFSRHR